MSSFPVQSGNFQYSFQFGPTTGVDNWVFNLGYESGLPSLFSSPEQKQLISGETGYSYNVALSNEYLFLSNTGSGYVEIFENNYLATPTGQDKFNKINRITGGAAGVDNISLGGSLVAVDGLVVVGDPDATVNGTSGVGAVFYFQDYLQGGNGVTGSSSFGLIRSETGTIESGNFSSSVGVVSYAGGDAVVSVGATGQNSGSGNIFIYDIETDGSLQQISPSGQDISKFGKNSSFATALSLNWLAVGYDQGGTGKVNIYKETAANSKSFEFFQEISGIESGDMFGYSIDSYGSSFVVGAPNLSGGSGAVYVYNYNSSLASFISSQSIAPNDRESGDYFGKSLAFDGVNGVIASNNNSGKCYIYYKNNQWSQISTISGSENIIDGSFGGNIHGSQALALEGNTLAVGSSEEPFSYYFSTGEEVTTSYTGLSFSGSGRKLYDADGNFIYGYGTDTTQISGIVFTGGYYSVFTKDQVLSSQSSRNAGVGSTGALNNWSISGESGLATYSLEIRS